MITGIFVVVNLLLALGLLAGFMALERAGRRMTTLLIILGLLVIECVIYPNPNTVPAGLFHPAVGGQALEGGSVDYGLSFRLPDILIPIALLARVLTSNTPARLQAAGLWWLAFAGWIVVSAAIGIHVGNSGGSSSPSKASCSCTSASWCWQAASQRPSTRAAMFRQFLVGSSFSP